MGKTICVLTVEGSQEYNYHRCNHDQGVFIILHNVHYRGTTNTALTTFVVSCNFHHDLQHNFAPL